MTTQAVDSSFYADPQGLNALRRDVRTNDPAAVKAAAKQFEALFTTMMLKSMRDATPKDGLFGSDQQDFYQDMFDQQLATQLSKGKGLGLADVLVQQLMRTGLAAPNAPAAPAAATAPSATSATAVQEQPPAKAALEAAAAVPAPTAATWPPASREAFVQALLPAAQAAGARLGVDPGTLIAHAALETGWGRSVPRNADGSSSFNLFGIKAGASWKGAVANAPTTEYVNGRPVALQAAFRSYDSPEACLQDYAGLLATRQRYAGALGTGADAQAFATGLRDGGYATDPAYVAKLTAVARDLKSARDLPLTGVESS